MADFMMIMKGPSGPNSEADWESYINKLQASGFFREGLVFTAVFTIATLYQSSSVSMKPPD